MDYKLDTKYDDLINLRCPQLGHQVPFKYCRCSNDNLPCRKIINCWSDDINVIEFLENNYDSQDLEKAFGITHSNKMIKIFDILKDVTK